MASIILADQWKIPEGLASLDAFGSWARSAAFPEEGRIDFLSGVVEIDMSPEELHAHGRVKTRIAHVLETLVGDTDLGDVFIDSTRVTSAAGGFSVEPDVVVALHESAEAGRFSFLAKSGGDPQRFVEIEGGPDVIVEIVSDGSVAKDSRRLPPLYFRAGVREYWLVDVRREVRFEVQRRGPSGFEPTTPDAEGFQLSEVLGRRFRLIRSTTRRGLPRFELETR